MNPACAGKEQEIITEGHVFVFAHRITQIGKNYGRRNEGDFICGGFGEFVADRQEADFVGFSHRELL